MRLLNDNLSFFSAISIVEHKKSPPLRQEGDFLCVRTDYRRINFWVVTILLSLTTRRK